MITNVTRGAGNVLTAQCSIHKIAMHQKPTKVLGIDVPIPVWTCPACAAEKEAKKNAGTN